MSKPAKQFTTEYTYVWMVERKGALGRWFGVSIHLTKEAAYAAKTKAQRVTDHVCSTPKQTVAAVSARLATAQ